MEYKLKGRLNLEDGVHEIEFEDISEYIEETRVIGYLLNERIELYYNDIPLDTTDIVDSEENIELIMEQIKEIDEEYEEAEELEKYSNIRL